jgi:AcrR family transcriptional regulator
MAKGSRKVRDLREDCLVEALRIIDKRGVEALSLREVARRLGVSHQAPYKHFASRDHILAELVGRAFAAFAAHLDARSRSEDPREDLSSLGAAYLGYAGRHPLQYRLMFGTPLPDPEQHPEMMLNARHAFAVLQETLRRRPGTSEEAASLDALFVWSAVHGVASMQQTNAIDTLDLPDRVLEASTRHAMGRIGAALEGTVEDRETAGRLVAAKSKTRKRR